MRRLPLLPTLLVAAAVAMMIGLGFWQLRRAEWKDRLIAEYTDNAALPPVDLDPLIRRGTEGEVPLAFRRVLITCWAGNTQTRVRGGRSLRGEPGWVYIVACRPTEEGDFAGNLDVNVGWSARPDAVEQVSLRGVVAGRLGAVERGRLVTLTAARPLAPLEASAPASIDNIPNNHLSYAFQWFFFAATAVVIYLLALRRRAPKLPPEP